MIRRKLLMLTAIFIIMIAGWLLIGNGGISAEEQAAEGHSVDFVAQQYSLQIDDIEVDTVSYWEEEDRYAVTLTNKQDNDSYQIALRLDEELKIAFILDVTGQFDEFGIAYCH